MNDKSIQAWISLIGILIVILVIVIGCQVTKKAENFCKDSGAKYGYEPSKITYDGKCCYEYSPTGTVCISKNQADKGEWLPSWLKQNH